jgi:PAS domain S-box-containing protein
MNGFLSSAVDSLDHVHLAFDSAFARRSEAAFLVVEGCITRCNVAATALSGHEVGQLVGAPFEQLIPMPERAHHRAQLELVLGDGPGVAAAPFELLRRDGRLLAVELRLARLPMPGVMVATLKDASDSSASLVQSESMRRNLFDAANDGIFVSDAAGFYVDVNPAGCRMLGYTREELVGRHLRELVVADGTPLKLDAIHEGRALVTERTLRRKDGTALTVEISASRVAGGLLQGIVRDLTERKRTEAALRHATRLDSLGRMAGGVAHDFNNMLMVIAEVTRELRERTVDPRNLTLFDELTHATDRAADLTRHLLAFARRQPVNARVVDVNTEVRAAARLFERVAVPASLRLELDPQRLEDRIDPLQFEQVLINLVVNARDAMPNGGTVCISTAAAEGSVVLTVTDTGEGMSDETLAHLFEPFFTTKEQGRGTGLGLATVYGIVTQSKGTVTATSKPGQGSTFRLALPRVVVS